MTMQVADTITAAGWTVVADGATAALVQLSSPGPVKVRMQAAAPSDANDKSGITLSMSGLGQIAVSDIPSGQKLYVRGVDKDTETVVVMYA